MLILCCQVSEVHHTCSVPYREKVWEGNVLQEAEIPGLEVQAPGSNITFVKILKSL